jgi:hypothetical protein
MPSWSGLFDGILPTGAVAGHRIQSDKNANERHVSRLLGKPSMRKLKELMLTLTGATAGATATDTYKRVKEEVVFGSPEINGGARTIETVTTVNRATTSADVTRIKDIIEDAWALTPAQYPEDKSGNGGGGKLSDRI